MYCMFYFLCTTGNITNTTDSFNQGSKNPGFFKKPKPVGFLGFWDFIGFFLDKREKIGKIIQKLSNLKP